ncbi:MAG TPA: hypothetical protein PLJ62_05475 [Thermoflexales bacterium]|nr:hypothetical protein [Thermoflexales bacterium]HQW36042.1 hypothetical protein [Thermoflexales bacterium]HQZ20704.1 hypothetical protein [Thermoflexales bacterium]HQZ99626.1 hypothetical protein [Thermoflexales bacterium]
MPNSSSPFWRKRAFQIVIAACAQFVVLTAIAMLVYPGGTSSDKATSGYSFFTNFFSDLGRTVAHNTQPNTIASVLFPVALTGAGAGLILFFIAFTQFFRQSALTRVLSFVGTLFGLGAGVCFIGVAFTPSNLFGALHGSFVLGAFGLFFVAVSVYVIPMLMENGYPSRHTLIFIAFAVMLGVYVWLMVNGPRGNTPDVAWVQPTAQKVIVYASLASVTLQSLAAMSVARARRN